MARPRMVSMQQRYIQLFTDWLRQQDANPVCLMDRAKGGATLIELHQQFLHDESYIAGRKDILIVHAGIVDCAPRPVPLGVRRVIGRLPAPLKNKIVSLLHHNRARLMEAGFRYHLTDRSVFGDVVASWMNEAINLFERVYLFNIAPTNEAIERHSPGLTQSIDAYNLALSSCAGSFKTQDVNLIDVGALFAESGHDLDTLIDPQDGHHLTALAHRICADALIRLEQARRSA